MWGLAQNNRLGLGPVRGPQPIRGVNMTQAIHVQVSQETKMTCPRSNFSSDTENSEQMYIPATETPILDT